MLESLKDLKWSEYLSDPHVFPLFWSCDQIDDLGTPEMKLQASEQLIRWGIISGGWATYPSEQWWSESSQLGWWKLMKFPIWWESHKIHYQILVNGRDYPILWKQIIQMFQSTNQFTYELQDQQVMSRALSPALRRTSAPVVGWVTHETQEFQDTLDIQSGARRSPRRFSGGFAHRSSRGCATKSGNGII